MSMLRISTLGLFVVLFSIYVCHFTLMIPVYLWYLSGSPCMISVPKVFPSEGGRAHEWSRASLMVDRLL